MLFSLITWFLCLDSLLVSLTNADMTYYIIGTQIDLTYTPFADDTTVELSLEYTNSTNGRQTWAIGKFPNNGTITTIPNITNTVQQMLIPASTSGSFVIVGEQSQQTHEFNPPIPIYQPLQIEATTSYTASLGSYYLATIEIQTDIVAGFVFGFNWTADFITIQDNMWKKQDVILPVTPVTNAPTPMPVTLAPTTRPPTPAPSAAPTTTAAPTTAAPTTASPTSAPSASPTASPTPKPTKSPTKKPTTAPTTSPPTLPPTKKPTPSPTKKPTPPPTKKPTPSPTKRPTSSPTKKPTPLPTKKPTPVPITPTTALPTHGPSTANPTTANPTTAAPTPRTSRPTGAPTPATTTTTSTAPPAVRHSRRLLQTSSKYTVRIEISKNLMSGPNSLLLAITGRFRQPDQSITLMTFYNVLGAPDLNTEILLYDSARISLWMKDYTLITAEPMPLKVNVSDSSLPLVVGLKPPGTMTYPLGCNPPFTQSGYNTFGWLASGYPKHSYFPPGNYSIGVYWYPNEISPSELSMYYLMSDGSPQTVRITNTSTKNPFIIYSISETSLGEEAEMNLTTAFNTTTLLKYNFVQMKNKTTIYASSNTSFSYDSTKPSNLIKVSVPDEGLSTEKDLETYINLIAYDCTGTAIFMNKIQVNITSSSSSSSSSGLGADAITGIVIASVLIVALGTLWFWTRPKDTDYHTMQDAE